IGRRGQQEEDSRRFDAIGDFLAEVTALAEAVVINPDIGFAPETLLDRRPQTVEKTADPVAVVTMRVADENIVLKSRNVGHRGLGASIIPQLGGRKAAISC